MKLFVVYLLSFVYSWFALTKLIISVILNGLRVFNVKPRDIPPFILNDSSLGKHSYIRLKKQGIKLHYVECGDKKKPLMVFLHGFPECWLTWRHQMREFSTNYWVVAVDLRGFGESEKPKGRANYQIDILIEDIREFITELGKPKTTLVSHDWGAVLAWSLVERYPDMFDRHITINGSPISVLRKLVVKSIKQFKMSWYIFFFQCPILPEILMRLQDLSTFAIILRGSKNLVSAFPDQVIEAYKFYYSKQGAFTPPLNYYRNLFQYEEKHSGKIKVPTLIIWGEQDTALSRDIAIRSENLCDDCQCIYLEEVGHFAHEEAPSEVNSIISNFLKTKTVSKIGY